MRTVVLGMIVVLVVSVSTFGELASEGAELVRVGMTICGAAIGLGVGSLLDPSPEGTPLSTCLLIMIPAAANSDGNGRTGRQMDR